MNGIMENERFRERYSRLAEVRLNPRRHTAANAMEHSEAVAGRAVAIAQANQATEREVALLANLGRAHDIGKITGTARPERSLEVLRDCGVDDSEFLALVKWHDTSLPWYLAKRKGNPPSEKAWRRLASEVDLRLLSMFMVADRVDAPPGWRRNAPTVWFLEEARSRGLLPDLRFDLPDHASEVSAGVALVREQDRREVLVIKVRAGHYELPKGGIEWDELPVEAAQRELREETGLLSPVERGPELDSVDYLVGDGNERCLKRVRYFLFRASAPADFGPLPERTRERCWLGASDVQAVPLVNEGLRSILQAALREEDGQG